MFKNTIFAHRGIHNNLDIPENSLPAFNEAVKNNINIELDLQLTKDNILVVFHDSNLKRMTGINKNINNCTYEELKELKLLNTNFNIPKFSEVLKLVNGKVLINIEIKDTNKINLVCKNVLKELEKYKHKIIIQSFNFKIIKKIKKLNNNIATGLLINEKYNSGIFGFLLIKYSKCNFLSISKKYIKKYKYNKIAKKYPILIWTIKNKEELNNYNDLMCGYICNNINLK